MALAATATNILPNPTAWAISAKVKEATRQHQSLPGAGTNAAARQLLSEPVTVNCDVPASSLIELDRKAVLSAYRQVQIATSTDSYFNKDSVAFRATFRFGPTVADTSRVVLLGVGAAERTWALEPRVMSLPPAAYDASTIAIVAHTKTKDDM